jgi:hypothetical protein
MNLHDTNCHEFSEVARMEMMARIERGAAISQSPHQLVLIREISVSVV